MSADVVSFDQSKEQLTSEHLKLDWYTRVEQTAKMAGIPLLEDLLCRKSTSICVKEGSGNLRDLTATNALITLEAFLRNISGSGADAYTWDRWEIDAKAASLAKSLSISTEFHPQEIISFYDDVSRHLSRRPADSQEFWHVLFVITKNRSDSKILSSISAERELDKICKGLSHDYKDSLARINVLDSALNYKAEVFGDIPDNFSSRFGSASEVVKLHDQECANAINLKNELVRLGSDLATSEAIINELRLEVSMLRPSENIPRSLELRKAQDDVELAKQFLTRLNQSNTELGLTIKMKESAISSLKTLNCRLTSFVREKNARVRHLERAQKLARTLSNRLAGMARRYKIAEATVKIELRDQRLLNEKLKEKDERVPPNKNTLYYRNRFAHIVFARHHVLYHNTMKMFVLTFLRGLSISLRSLKILVVIGVIVGVIVTYTAYKAAPVTKDSISNVVRNDFSGVSIKQTSQDGLRIIELYDRATRIPDLVGLKLLYQSVAMEVESGSGIVKINGDSAFKDESINARMDFFRIQINYISQPIMSGFILGLSISLLTYLLIIGAKGLQTTVKYIFQRLMETKKTIH